VRATLPPSAERAIGATIARYAIARAADRNYVKFKLRTDPLTLELVRRETYLGDVIDVGCGRGQFGLLLWELGRVKSLYGYDWDRAKVETAILAAGGVGRYQIADLRAPPTPSADTILLFDVLQYLSTDEQRSLLKKLVVSLRPRGRLLVRAADRGLGWQARFSQALEGLGRLVNINRSHTLSFRSSEDLRADLEALGLAVESAERGRSSLLDNRLWIAELVAEP
jgi:SAM-dependent methyltransferase